MDERLDELTKICCEWNRRDLDAREAMHKIWKLFLKENIEAWRVECRAKKMEATA